MLGEDFCYVYASKRKAAFPACLNVGVIYALAWRNRAGLDKIVSTFLILVELIFVGMENVILQEP